MKVEQGELSSYNALYEFAYGYYGDWEFAWVLNQTETLTGKDVVESFLYGKEIVPTTENFKLKDYHNAEGSGLTVLRGDNKRYLLFKHSPFGGKLKSSAGFLAYQDSFSNKKTLKYLHDIKFIQGPNLVITD